MTPAKIPDDLAERLMIAIKYREAEKTGIFFGRFTPEEHHERFRKLSAEYRASLCAKDIEDLLRSKKPADGWPIEKAVAFGLGSFSQVYWPGKNNRSAAYYRQLASFLHIVEILQESVEKSIPKYAQEPLFQSTDQLFLEQLGIEVVEDPKGLSLVSATTFAYCPYLPCYVPILLQDELPALYMGNEPNNAIWMASGALVMTEREKSKAFRELAQEVRAQLPDGFLSEEQPKQKLDLAADDGPDAPLQRHTKHQKRYLQLGKDLTALIKFKKSRAVFKPQDCIKRGRPCEVCLFVHIDRSILGLEQQPPVRSPYFPEETMYPFLEWPLD